MLRLLKNKIAEPDNQTRATVHFNQSTPTTTVNQVGGALIYQMTQVQNASVVQKINFPNSIPRASVISLS